MAKGLSLRAYSRHRKALGLRGGTLNAVQDAIKNGRIQKNTDGLIGTVEELDRQWEASIQPDAAVRLATRDLTAAVQADPAPAPKPPAAEKETRAAEADQISPASSQFQKARARREELRAENEEMELLKRRGSVLDAREEEERDEARAAAFREHILNLPGEYSAEVAASLGADEGKVYRLLDRIVRKHLMEISQSLALQAA